MPGGVAGAQPIMAVPYADLAAEVIAHPVQALPQASR